MAKQELKIEKTDEKVYNLEELITEGTSVRIPITFELPTNDGTVTVGAILKPVSSVEYNNALKAYQHNIYMFNIALVSLGLLNNNGEEIDRELIGKMPVGVVNELATQIQDLSGIKQDENEQYQFTKDLMGF